MLWIKTNLWQFLSIVKCIWVSSCKNVSTAVINWIFFCSFTDVTSLLKRRWWLTRCAKRSFASQWSMSWIKLSLEDFDSEECSYQRCMGYFSSWPNELTTRETLIDRNFSKDYRRRRKYLQKALRYHSTLFVIFWAHFWSYFMQIWSHFGLFGSILAFSWLRDAVAVLKDHKLLFWF